MRSTVPAPPNLTFALSSAVACPPPTRTHTRPHPHAPQQSAQKKVLDVINSVGLGDSVLRMIERRHEGDTYLALGGMGAVMLLTGGLLWWVWS